MVGHGSMNSTRLKVNERGPLRLEYGVRYLNVVTKATQDCLLVDRNVGVLPFVTFNFGIGRS